MKAPHHLYRRSTPFAFPSNVAGSGEGAEPSSGQIAAASRQASKEQEGFGDEATTMQSLAQLAPTSQTTHLAGAAVRGLRRAAGF